jgi:hypothetical protein
MPISLPSSLPLNNLPNNRVGGLGRAQDFSVSRLNYRKDRDNAKISINSVLQGQSQKTLMKKELITGDSGISEAQVVSTSQGGVRSSGPSTSISHPGQSGIVATTSIFHPGINQGSEDGLSDAERDERRYEMARQHLMKARKEREAKAAAAAAPTPDVFDLGFKTGSGFRIHGKYGLLRKMHHLKKTKPLAYKHWDKEDEKYLAGLVKPHLQGVSRGTSIGYAMRRKMKYQIERDRRAGKIDVYTSRDMKKIVNDLPS